MLLIAYYKQVMEYEHSMALESTVEEHFTKHMARYRKYRSKLNAAVRKHIKS